MTKKGKKSKQCWKKNNRKSAGVEAGAKVSQETLRRQLDHERIRAWEPKPFRHHCLKFSIIFYIGMSRVDVTNCKYHIHPLSATRAARERTSVTDIRHAQAASRDIPLTAECLGRATAFFGARHERVAPVEGPPAPLAPLSLVLQRQGSVPTAPVHWARVTESIRHPIQPTQRHECLGRVCPDGRLLVDNQDRWRGLVAQTTPSNHQVPALRGARRQPRNPSGQCPLEEVQHLKSLFEGSVPSWYQNSPVGEIHTANSA